MVEIYEMELNLEKLLKGLVKVEGLHWIRMLYSYPKASQFHRRAS